MGSFFSDCEGLSIYGGNFNEVGGDLTINNNYSQYDREMPSMPSGYREDRTGFPPPQSPPFSSPQNPSTFPFQAPFPQQMGVGGPPGSHISANNANIQYMNQYLHWCQEQWLLSMISQTQSMVAGNSGGNYGPQIAYSSSRNADSVNTGMANLAVNDFRPQVPASPPTSFSSEPQIGLNPSTSAVQQGSHSNPSPALHMNDQDMVDSHSPPITNPHGINPNRPLPPTSTSPSDFPPSSSSGPSFHAYYGQDSSNGNSFVDPTGERSATESNKNRGFSDPNVPIGTRKKKDNGVRTSRYPNRIDEESSPNET